MSLRCRKGSAVQSTRWVGVRWLLLGATLLFMLVTWPPSLGEGVETQAGRQLRVCADPNNLPFSNQQGEGFENRIAELIARELHATVQYTWWAQRRGFIRNTLKAGTCDVMLGVPSHFDLALTTSPYYRSTYVFVYRQDKGLTIRSFDDPLLHYLRIGVQLIGDDYTNTPPAHALANRDIINNVVGYTVYGNYSQANPAAKVGYGGGGRG
jgi:mxaJ protein